MNKRKLIPLLIFILLFSLGRTFLKVDFLLAQVHEEKLQKLTREIEEYEREIEKLESKATTLSNQIAQYDAQIHLTILKISQTEEKIVSLGGRIDRL